MRVGQRVALLRSLTSHLIILLSLPLELWGEVIQGLYFPLKLMVNLHWGDPNFVFPLAVPRGRGWGGTEVEFGNLAWGGDWIGPGRVLMLEVSVPMILVVKDRLEGNPWAGSSG